MQSSGVEGVRKRRQVGKDVSQAHDKEQLVSVEVPGSVWDRFVSYLTAPTDPSNLAILRIMYGLLMLIDIPQERGMASIFYRWQEGACIFPLFNFLRPLSTEWMYMVYLVMFLGALGIFLGFMYRLSCLSFVVTYWYIFFLDKTVWNNHSYLYGLISIMLLLCDANRYWSVDALLNPRIHNAHVPRWNYVILRFQIFIVYFFAGLKKIDMDWMTGYSMTGLSRKWVFAPFVSIFGEEFVDLWMVHGGGLVFDLTEGFLLAWSKTRVFGTLLGLMFHGMNSQMFHIGMFPYAMIATMPLFYSTEWPKKLMSKLPSWMQYCLPSTEDAKSSCHCVYSAVVSEEKVKEEREAKDAPKRSTKPKISHQAVVCVMLAYIAVQSALPYSHFITKGYNAWTKGLYGYSWDMMVHSWSTQHVRIKVVDNATGEVTFIRPGAFIGGSDSRHSRWNSHPDMIKQYTTCLAEHLKVHEGLNITEPAVYLDVWRSMNRRFQQRLVDPNVDMVAASWSPFKHSPWVKPLLLELSPWRKKLDEITTALDEKSNFTDVVFVADFPGLMLENFVDPELNASITVLNGKVNIEVNNTNITLGVDDELYVPSNDTHMVYTVSDTPSCWMYVYTNMTILNNETLRNWILHPETVPQGNSSSRQYKNMTRWQKFQFFVFKKYALFAESFTNTFYSGRYLIFGTKPPFYEVEEGAEETTSSTGSDSETQTGSADKDKDKEGSTDKGDVQIEDDAATGKNTDTKTGAVDGDTGRRVPGNSAGVAS